MQGQAQTLAAFKHLSETGKQLKESWKKRWAKRSTLSKIASLPLLIINSLFLSIKKVWRALLPVMRFGFGSLLVFCSFVGLGIAGVGSLFLLLYNNSSYRLAFVPISELTSMMPYVLIVIAGFLSLAIPAILIMIGGLAIIRRKNIINFSTGSIIVGIWMAAGIFFCAMGLRYFPEALDKFENYPIKSQAERAVDMQGIKSVAAKGNRINITISANTSTLPTIRGRMIDLNSIELRREGDKLSISEKLMPLSDKACLECNLHPIEFTVATGTKLEIITASGAFVHDETKIIAEETE
jgi:hypothetical protein